MIAINDSDSDSDDGCWWYANNGNIDEGGVNLM